MAIHSCHLNSDFTLHLQNQKIHDGDGMNTSLLDKYGPNQRGSYQMAPDANKIGAHKGRHA